MAKTKEQKQEILNSLKEKIEKQKSIVFVDFSKIKVKNLTELRKKMGESDCEFKVAKKTLIQKAFQDSNPKMGDSVRDLQGEIGLGFGYSDEVAPFKISGDFSKTNENFKLLGGLIDEEIFGNEQAKTLSELPTKQELLAKMVGSIGAPISGFVNALQGNIRNLVYVLNAIKGR
ncbi:50S ribosomal protein L10 [Candidatus Parcubacteria bacterium]|jgi:large subunit ribosomal protein L10|nr:50S ribosomal protein L10 [Candidatus Parcubacteria bacterium]